MQVTIERRVVSFFNPLQISIQNEINCKSGNCNLPRFYLDHTVVKGVSIRLQVFFFVELYYVIEPCMGHTNKKIICLVMASQFKLCTRTPTMTLMKSSSTCWVDY